MYNFISYKLQPAVRSDTVEDDFHPLSNLIAKNKQQLDQGFMAYSVTKPPVEIIFNLYCPIAIHNIKIWAQIGALQTTSIEVYGQNKKGNFDKLGYGESQNAATFQFLNARKEATHHPALPGVVRHVLYPTMGHILANCSVIKIVLRKTARCVPVLRKIEIWGEPARSCTPLIKEEVRKMWHENIEHFNPVFIEPKQIDDGPNLSDIPEDFLDELTCSIMTIPFILPSGKIVDQMTIHKHNEQEEKWGRQPSDPFTGLLYTEKRKPIFNPALKSRIDEFLLKHSDSSKFQSVPRTVSSNLRSSFNSDLPYSHSVPKRRKLENKSAEINTQCSPLEFAQFEFVQSVQNLFKVFSQRPQDILYLVVLTKQTLNAGVVASKTNACIRLLLVSISSVEIV
ncbi:RING finger protein 37 [Toxorhynchites rutilus septentrionalis]|uniref:RING finger protein 37 n=1 Tax=Toxorhynchites rutilus septentrionalis TaxID=329112 RepID=UPI0024791C4A|nr:RING finger protein 37 [Toxorhynchites rutilus septentrionalis]